MKRLMTLAALVGALLPMHAYAATERMPCKHTEAKLTVSGSYVFVACPTEGRLMPEGMHVYFQGDYRDFVNRNAKLVPLDGPVGGTAGQPDPRVAELQAQIASLKAKLQSLANSL